MKETVTKMEEEVCKYVTEMKCHEENCHDTKVSVPKEETKELCETRNLKKCDDNTVKCETIFSCEEAALEVQMLSVSVCLFVRLWSKLNFTGRDK